MRVSMLRQVPCGLQLLGHQLKRSPAACTSGFCTSGSLGTSGDDRPKLYELRTYQIKPALFWEFMEILEEKVHLRKEMSKMVGFWTVDLGGLNQVVNMWEYGKQDQFWKVGMGV
ncbi:protein NipSnap homolog 3B-like [Branchiostoma floridae x Branchiostoma japonicum]